MWLVLETFFCNISTGAGDGIMKQGERKDIKPTVVDLEPVHSG